MRTRSYQHRYDESCALVQQDVKKNETEEHGAAYHRVRSTDNRGAREWSGRRVTAMHQTGVLTLSRTYHITSAHTSAPQPHPPIPANMLRAYFHSTTRRYQHHQSAAFPAQG